MQEPCSTLAGVGHFGHLFSAFWLSCGCRQFTVDFSDCSAMMPPSELYPKSLLLHFPPQVYQRTSPSDLLPKVLEIVEPEVLKCAQFLQGGKVRLSFKEKSGCDHLLYEGLCVDEVDIPVTEHGKKLTIVYLCDLPFEVFSDLYDFFADYGDVATIERSISSTCSSLFDGNRVVKIVLDKEIPYFLSVLGHDCRARYRD